MKTKAPKIIKTVSQLREEAQKLLAKAKDQELREKNKAILDLGTLVISYVDKNITFGEFSEYVKKITGKEFQGEQKGGSSFSDKEIDQALK